MKPKEVLRKIRDIGRPPHHENVAYNRDTWDRYADGWNPRRVTVEDPLIPADERTAAIRILGDEWGNRADVEQVVRDFITPYVNGASRVAEIGSGGGRVAALVLPTVEHLTCFDISKKMLERCRATLGNDPRADFVLLAEPQFESRFDGAFDFVYSFDVFVHLDLHTMWKYVRALPSLLRPGGKAFLHTSNLTAPGGWANFARQKKYSVLDHYFIVPQTIDVLLEHAGLRLVATSTIEPGNFYYNRDYLFVVEPIAK